jgi:uncharacterized protein (TIGR03382 family)
MTPSGSLRGRSAMLMLSVCAAVVVGADVQASVHGWDYTPGAPGISSIDNSGGTFAAIDARFDSQTRQLDWTVEFSDRVTEGLALVVSDGSAPQTRRGQYAMIYFDAADAITNQTLSPKLTAYAYNGRGVPDSWFDGDGDPTNNGVHQPRPDCIKDLLDVGWVLSSQVSDVTLPGGELGRRFSLSIDATDLISHSPEFPGGPSAAWRGTGFAQTLGLWMFTSQIFDVAYNDDGEIRSFGSEHRGSMEGNAVRTFDIPAPGAAALMAVGVLVLGRRRR